MPESSASSKPLRISVILILVLAVLLLLGFTPPILAQKGGEETVLSHPYISQPVSPVDTNGLGLAKILPSRPGAPIIREVRPLPRRKPIQNEAFLTTPSIQSFQGATAMPAPLANWEGIAATGVLPPDTNGQVGPNHFVEIVNSSSGSQVRIWDKTGAQLYDFDLRTLWPTSDICYKNANGDPVVLYDQLADRWVLTQFALPDPPYYECFAISKNGTPTNNPNDWHLYSFKVHDTKMNDYPKLAVWPDGYYMSANQFKNNDWAGAGVWVFDRNAMIQGNPATFQYFDVADMNINYGGLLPSNLMGSTLPPNGAPNYFMSVDMDWSGSDDVLHVFEFHTDWTTPSNSTFQFVKDITVDPFNWNFDGSGGYRDNWDIPQPGTSVELDSLSDRLMMHLWYRNYGDHESLVVNHTVNVGNGSDHAGIRWYEIRDTTINTTLSEATIYQQGTYAPDSENRWMGSVAMDHVGNLAIGYSISSSSVFPGIRYAGRLQGDPLGTITQAEATLVNGGGSQTHDAARWGDYSSLTIDPKDDCTFWYTTEYMASTSSSNWRTRVGSFKFSDCSMESDFTLGATPASQSICSNNDATYTVDVDSVGGFTAPVTLSASGQPASSTTNFNPNPVLPPGSSTLTIGNNAAASAGTYNITIQGVGDNITHTTSVDLVLFTTTPAGPSLVTPVDQATGVSTSPTFSWNAVANAEDYTLEVATDETFTQIAYSADHISGTSHTPTTPLSGNTTYYWRVKANNPCGATWSTIYTFSTASVFCSTPQLAIPDNNAVGASDTISATGEVIQGLYVSLDIDHTYVGDLTINLKHVDTGSAVTLIDRPGIPGSDYGCSGNDIDADIDDYGPDGDAEAMCDNAPAIHGRVHGGDPASATLLHAFNGESISGEWLLTVSDHASADSGQIVEWCVAFNDCQGVTSDVTDLTIDKSGKDVILRWKNLSGDTYEIYRVENNPYFTPSDANAIAQTNDDFFTDTNALGDSTTNYSYKVRGFNLCPPLPGYTERVSEFDFPLVPGN